jgi:hypothetical protein
MCRQYDEVGIRTLGAYAGCETVDPRIRIEAIKVLLDRGHGRPKGEKKHKHTGPDGKEPVTVKIVYERRDGDERRDAIRACRYPPGPRPGKRATVNAMAGLG